MYQLQCGNADMRVANCLLNHGYTMTAWKGIAAHHHIKSLASMLSAAKSANTSAYYQPFIDTYVIEHPS